MKSSNKLSLHTGEGIVIDLGTGDGRFVSEAARMNPNKFFIGVDANVKPLEKLSNRATRKPSKGGLPNAMFVQAAAEDLPEELDGVANEIHIHFPWGSLLKATATGERGFLASLRRIAADECTLEIIIGIDPDRDNSELKRLGLPPITPIFVHSYLIPSFINAGFELLEARTLSRAEWASIETSWAKRLRNGDSRTAFLIEFALERTNGGSPIASNRGLMPNINS